MTVRLDVGDSALHIGSHSLETSDNVVVASASFNGSEPLTYDVTGVASSGIGGVTGLAADMHNVLGLTTLEGTYDDTGPSLGADIFIASFDPSGSATAHVTLGEDAPGRQAPVHDIVAGGDRLFVAFETNYPFMVGDLTYGGDGPSSYVVEIENAATP